MTSIKYWSVELRIVWSDPCQPTWALSCPAETHIRKATWDDVVLTEQTLDAAHTQEAIDRAKGLIKRLKGNHVNRIGNAKEIRLFKVRNIEQDEFNELTNAGVKV